MVVLVLNMCVINSIIKCKGGVISDIKLPESGNLSNMIHLYAVMMSDAKKKKKSNQNGGTFKNSCRN